jgi:hypothetical protein
MCLCIQLSINLIISYLNICLLDMYETFITVFSNIISCNSVLKYDAICFKLFDY